MASIRQVASASQQLGPGDTQASGKFSRGLFRELHILRVRELLVFILSIILIIRELLLIFIIQEKINFGENL